MFNGVKSSPTGLIIFFVVKLIREKKTEVVRFVCAL